ncbi:MAG: ribosome biogenesis GTPase Der [Prolixibacteraceae bacterium]|nr:ribosome biogenesis GTPase Der [Prolixibacteraceae bacterium]
MSNIIAIVGRPNVGKSTLFNRMVESRKAIVDDVSGVTRDRIYGKGVWNGTDFSIIDTGGYVISSADVFEQEIKKQVHLAIDEADVILFVVDVENGITDLDEAIAQLLRKEEKPVFLVVNKVDNNQRINDSYEFYNLGLGDLYCISSINGSGTGDLLDKVVEAFPKETIPEEEADIPHFAIIGRPNVGKSSMINALTDENRHIVTEIAGTTRDSNQSRYNKFGHDFILTDTAGLRKKGKVHENIEFYSVMRSIRAIEQADVCLLLVDATRGIEAQDVNIFNIVMRNKKGIVILVNKWDLVEKNQKSTNEFTEIIKERIAPFSDVPVVFTSALTKQRLLKSFETAMKVYESRKSRIKTSALNQYMLEAIEQFSPPSVKGKFIKIKYVTQLPTPTPTFAFYANLPQYIKDPYKRYLENKIRENWDFEGVPINIVIRGK